MSKGSIQSLEDIKFVPTQSILLSKIKFDEKNPNVLSTVKNEALLHTVNKYGFAVDPWLNDLGDGTYLVIDGEHRIKLLLEKGVKSVKAKIFKVKYVEVQMLRQIANKLRGEHDKTKDADEFKSIFEGKRLDEFAKLLGEPIEDFQSILEKKFDIQFAKQEGEIPEPPIEPKSKLGDIYQLGNHRVMCGDSTNKESINRLLADSKVDSLQTDPPYGIEYGDKNAELNKNLGGNRIEKPFANDNVIQDYQEFTKSFLDIIPFSEYNTIYFWMSNLRSNEILNAFKECKIKYHQTLIWIKNNHVIGRLDHNPKHESCFYGWKGKHKFYGGFKTDILEYDKPLANKLHPTMKPPEMIAELIKESTTQNAIVYDPFLGSGSTLIACEQTNRICYGMELDPAYVDVIIQRWENFTGNKAKLLLYQK